MVRGKRLSDLVRSAIVKSYLKGESITSIGKGLDIPRTTISAIIAAFKKNGSTEQKPKAGRKCNLTVRKAVALKTTIIKNRKETVQNVSLEFEKNTGSKISKATCGRWMRKIGFKHYKVKLILFDKDNSK